MILPKRARQRQVGEGFGEAALSMVPIVGGPLSVLWVQFVGAAYEKRRQAWAEEISEAVNDLLARVDNLEGEDLAANEQFLDALAYATSTAVTTAHREKLEALRNAVLNAALPSDIDSDTQAIFLRHVRDLTPSHLRLLKLLSDPLAWFERRGIPWPNNIISGGLGKNVIEVGIPEFANRRELYDQLERDLTSAGLTNTGGLHTLMSANGLTASRASDMGEEFLKFISDPRDELAYPR
jgi:hypothetical protein